MKPGLYRDMPFKEYLAVDALSSSGIKKLLRSPAHYQEWRRNPPEPTPAMLLGSAFHCLLLEPESFQGRFCVAPQVNGRTKDGKAALEAFAALSEGKAVLSVVDMETLTAMRDSAMKLATVEALVHDRETELSIFWDDPEYGFPCKARLDLRCSILPGIVDLKTCEDASPDGFGRQCWNMGYDIQASHYTAGAATVGWGDHNFYFLAVEKKPPYLAAVYAADEDFIRIGNSRRNNMRALYAECLESGDWPGYGDRVRTLSLPAWAKHAA